MDRRNEFSVDGAHKLLLEYDVKKAECAARGVLPPIRVAGLLPPRNGPCPCGSGRKYKVCCRRVQPYVPDRINPDA